MNIVESMGAFEASEPRTCVWCAMGGLMTNAGDRLDAVVCLDARTAVTRKKDAPANREYRVYLKVMDGMESCERWQPTRVGSVRLKLLDAFGLLEERTEDE